MTKSTKQVAAPKAGTVTAKLFNLFDQAANAAQFTVDMARTAAKAAKLNATSAEIAFYHWRMARGFYAKSAAPLAR